MGVANITGNVLTDSGSSLSSYLPLTGGTLTGDLTLNNGAADGAQLVLASSGFSNWNIDNFSGRFRAYYGSTEYLTITSAGNVGIGTSSPSAWNGNQGLLVTQTGTGNTNTIYSLQSGATSVDTGSILEGFSTNTTSGSKALGSIVFLRENTSTTALSSYTAFYTNNAGTVSEKMRISSGGNVGIGTTSPSTPLYVVGSMKSETGLYFNNATTNGAFVWQEANTPLRFATNDTERMRITSGGDLLIGKSSLNWQSAGLQTESNGTNLGITNPNSSNNLFIRKNNATGAMIQFWYNSSDVGSITISTTNTTYNTGASDRTLKKNFENWNEDVVALFRNINPLKFNYLDQEDNEEKIKGFIAQEMVDKFPEAYPINEKGLYSFNPSGMVVYLMKAIQELSAEVELLKNK